MGNSSSSKVKKMNEVITSTSINTVNEQINSSSATQINRNEITFIVGRDLNCSLKTNQTIEAGQNLKVIAKIKSDADLKVTINSILDDTTQNHSEQVTGFLSTAVANSSESVSDITNRIKNDVNINIGSKLRNDINLFIEDLNKGLFIFGRDANCLEGEQSIVINQDIITNQIAELYSEAIVSAALKGDFTNKLVAELEQSSKQENTGLFESLGNLLGGMWIIFAIIGVVVIVIVALLLWPEGEALKKKDKDTP
jgi:hypothetical protein